MDELMELYIKEELAEFGANEELCLLEMMSDTPSVFTLSESEGVEFVFDEELCKFSLVISTNTYDDMYEPLYCKDGIVCASDGEPIYVLRWRIGMN